jgi:polyisoprenoid-binding protein YceI
MQKFIPVLAGAALLASPFPAATAQPIPAPPPQIEPAAVQPGVYAVEPIHTRILFSLSHISFTTWYGEFLNASGTLDLNPKAPEKSTVEIDIPANTVWTSNAILDGELKGDKWFDVAKYPDIAFKSDRLVLTGAATGALTGDLTFHGVTKPVTLSVKFNNAGVNPIDNKYTVGFEATGRIKRGDFGVGAYAPLIGDEVDLTISAGFEKVEK